MCLVIPTPDPQEAVSLRRGKGGSASFLATPAAPAQRRYSVAIARVNEPGAHPVRKALRWGSWVSRASRKQESEKPGVPKPGAHDPREEGSDSQASGAHDPSEAGSHSQSPAATDTQWRYGPE